MRRQRLQIRISTILFLFVGYSIYSVDAEAVTSKSQIQTKAKLKKPSKRSTEVTVLPGDISEKSEKELIGLIKGFQAIIKTPGQGKNRNSYILSQMASYLALSRIYRIKIDASEQDKKNEALSLERVLKFMEYFKRNTTVSNEEKAKALFYGGQAHIYKDQYKLAIEDFQEAIKMDTKSPYVGTMALFIAETWFDEEKYTEAIQQYNAYFKNLNPIEKALAIYKIAWCLLNLNRYEEAEKNYMILIGKNWAGHFSADSLKDLAYTGTLFRSEQEFIEQSYKLFKDPELQLEYLMQGFNFFLAQSSSQKRPLLFAELLRRVKDPTKKLNLLLIDFHGLQKQYAAHEPFRAFLSIESYIKSEKMTATSEPFIANQEQLESEVIYLAKNYSDVYLGKIKTPEKFEDDELVRTLKYILNFHLEYFPKSKEREISYKNLLSLCTKQKDSLCVYNLSNQILAEEFGKEFKDAVLLEKINAIEVLLPKNQNLHAEQIISIEKYVVESPASENWLMLTKRLTVLLNEEKLFMRSIPWLEKIHAKENTSESLYRLQLTKFDNGDYKGVVENRGPLPKDENGIKVQKLISESYIRMAETSIKSGDFTSYEKNMNSFLETNTDNVKEKAAKADYYERLMGRKEFDKVYSEIKVMGFKNRFSKDFSKITQRVQTHFMQIMDWGKVESLYSDAGTIPLSVEAKHQYLFSVLAQNRNLSNSEVQILLTLSDSDRDYYLYLIVLTKPDQYMELFNKFKMLSSKEKSFYLLSKQINQGKLEPELSEQDQVVLNDVLPAPMKYKKIKSLEYFEKVVIPTPAYSSKKFENYLKDAIYRVRRSRKLVAEDLKKTNYANQVLILAKAMSMEKLLAEAIVNSPIPEDLEISMKSEYKKKLTELSEEFISQSAEFEKIRENIEKTMTQGISRTTRLMNLDVWPWPKNPKIEPIQKSMSDRSFILSFLLLDQLRNSKEISTEDYFEAKSRMNLLVISNEFAVDFIYDELTQNHQVTLLKKWDNETEAKEPVK